MEEFLKDSPSDYNNQFNGSSSTATPNVGNSQYSGPGSSNGNFPGSDFSLEDVGVNYNNNNPQEFLSPGSKQQPFNQYGNYSEYNNGLNPEQVDFTNPVNTLNDPFLEDLENLNFPQNMGLNPQNTDQFINPATTSNLDEIISPQNNTSLDNNNTFLNPRYFSPPNRNVNFNSLNSIAEDSNTFSPNLSRHGSISVPNNQYSNSFNTVTGPDINSGSYLSPQANSQYVSPNYDSFDTLKSPSNSYLSSPPQYQHSRAPSGNISTSIPAPHIKQEANPNLLSPPNTSSMSTSVPSGGTSRDSLPTKQLTKEEKLKRRREFHNAVERRRRDLIKERIKELGLIVPPSLLNPQLCAVQMLQKNTSLNSTGINDLIASIKVKETKPNKSTILNKSVDYIEHLKYVLSQQEKAKAELAKKILALQRSLNNNQGSNPVQSTRSELTNIGNEQNSNNHNFSGLDNGNIENENYFNPDDFFSDMIGNNNANSNGLGNTNANSEFF